MEKQIFEGIAPVGRVGTWVESLCDDGQDQVRSVAVQDFCL
jgi:hypothetical protein